MANIRVRDTEILEAALAGLQHRRSAIEEKMAELRQRLDGGAGQVGRKSAEVDSGTATPKKRTMSAAARRRIAVAQRKRWAAIKRVEARAAPKKRRISAAGRKRIIAATKKRWAEYNAKKAAAAKKSAKTVGKKAATTG